MNSEFEQIRAKQKAEAEEKAKELGLHIGMKVSRTHQGNTIEWEILGFKKHRWTNSGYVIRCSVSMVNSPTGYCREMDIGKDGMTFQYSPD